MRQKRCVRRGSRVKKIELLHYIRQMRCCQVVKCQMRCCQVVKCHLKMDAFEITELVLITFCVYKAYKHAKTLKRRRKNRVWVREVNLSRDADGFFEKCFEELKQKDAQQFRRATRMSSEVFDTLFSLLEDSLTKYSPRKPIAAKCRLFLTLVYLAQGTSRQYLAMTFKMGVETVRKIVLETCDLIWTELSGVYLSPPSITDWQNIERDFHRIWDLPNCIGAVDGKHIEITCPPNSGSQFFNYKGRYSIVLMAICDANYFFKLVDVGAYGGQSDGGVFGASLFGKAIIQGKLNLPGDKPLDFKGVPFPHYFVGDAAFPLKENLMRPYPGRLLSSEHENFNRRLSRARRTIENAFGILTARWRILRSTMNMHPEAAEKVVKAAIVLHNFVKLTDPNYCAPESVDSYNGCETIPGLWRKEVTPLPSVRQVASNNSSRQAFKLRNYLCDYLFDYKK